MANSIKYFQEVKKDKGWKEYAGFSDYLHDMTRAVSNRGELGMVTRFHSKELSEVEEAANLSFDTWPNLRITVFYSSKFNSSTFIFIIVLYEFASFILFYAF